MHLIRLGHFTTGLAKRFCFRRWVRLATVDARDVRQGAGSSVHPWESVLRDKPDYHALTGDPVNEKV